MSDQRFHIVLLDGPRAGGIFASTRHEHQVAYVPAPDETETDENTFYAWDSLDASGMPVGLEKRRRKLLAVDSKTEGPGSSSLIVSGAGDLAEILVSIDGAEPVSEPVIGGRALIEIRCPIDRSFIVEIDQPAYRLPPTVVRVLR